MKIKKMCVIILMSIFVSVFAINCYATTETTKATSKITKEQLNEELLELKDYINSNKEDDEEKINKITVEDKVIDVTTEKGNYQINYELGEKTTFSIETEVKQGMSYEEYKRNTENIDNVFWGYFAISNILGVKYDDSVLYSALVKLSNLNGATDTSDSYIVYIPAPGVTLTDPDEKTIISTEFGNRAMEYFNSVYKEDKYTYNDSEQYNTFECVIEKKEKTNESCKLIETLTINTGADFSKIKGGSDSLLDNGITKDNADYAYTLKIGQKLKFETTEKFSGYDSTGIGVELSEKNTELVAVKKGVTKGHIIFGTNTKTFYISVEENTNNEKLEDIIVKIGETTKSTKTTSTKTTENTTNNTNDKVIDNTTSKTELPKTGIDTVIGAVTIILIAIVTFAILNKKYEDIK